LLLAIWIGLGAGAGLGEFGIAILSTVVILAVAFFYSGIMEAIGWR
jgi:uncharacterized membrane protein YhiD involved in acid resistance